jgi:hypothetical protein
LDLTNFTASIFVDGTKGTDIVTSAAPTEASSPNMEIGSKSTGEFWDGQIRRIHSLQYVPSDAEAARIV